ncbi:beta-lactamase class B [Amycolatopsis mediterranei S699]|uniref:Beta-lactamase class B n=3 Tax=Amycolatopsis mediterranei TaxID=33910 RepID=A0A0H3DH49_AMYMU|nr:beta-lactamase class B [Amycolatopsis mediterranei U32]AEK45913.1 beta-lactamase class B [Amycolatopsis mediterranei S699]AFO80672.1 beta-lactamase class B [Amycolatopsis mediterranei S699]AGT87800.1 beta-lactamase class B [Amycolatopsis mediterranei RB]KDU93918.1 beta-lactamase [Amycolatopsis mediterranei]
MSRRKFAQLAAMAGAGTLLLPGTATAENGRTAQYYYDHAYRLAGDDPVLLDIIAALTPGFTVPRPTAPAPMKIFDNLAVLGVGWVSAVAVLTSDGIILIDALTSTADAETVIVPGLRSLGADPATVKYVVVTHGHGDHFGGAQYFADNYGARVLAAPADWDHMEDAGQPGRPVRDLDISDGQRLTLGDTTLTLHHTPGHTPGTVSPVIPLRANGRRHTGMLWGGTKPPADIATLETYLSSVEKFRFRLRQARVDVELSNHPFCDHGLERMQQMLDSPRATNPFILGTDGTQRFMNVMDAMVHGLILDAGTTPATTSLIGHRCC